ncbi:hypothetical protein TIFTF001_031165 [Ficus carica]|uniref:Oxysterol-binding protein n=1 Tax=Ficus carica TaxID=3494 RepID=A0AA88J0M3_FICCA|nr:hypothetical protein TIFTF001_031165 [Ficus carica]
MFSSQLLYIVFLLILLLLLLVTECKTTARSDFLHINVLLRTFFVALCRISLFPLLGVPECPYGRHSNAQDIEQTEEKKIVLSKPLSLDQGDSPHGDHKPPNLIQRVLSLFKDIRPGSDLTTMQLPPLFNLPKSHLQVYGESVYCVGKDMLGKCSSGESPVERFIAVVAWSISTDRPWIFGFVPYNSILGETHHVSRGTLNVLFEQISHHPPVTALHATDEEQHLELLWCQHAVPKFYGTSVEVVVHGKRELKLLNQGETYAFKPPKLSIKFLPVPKTEWAGTQRIRCKETDLEAEFSYGEKSFLGYKGNPRSVKGKIFFSSSSKPIFEIDGHWDNVVNEGILSKDWGKAREAKKAVEERQRELLRERKSRGETWVPKHFIVSCTNKDGWDCSPIEKIVPPAPIVVPL